MDHLTQTTVLVTGGGAPGAAGIIKAITKSGRYKVIAADARPVTVGKLLADDYVQIPAGNDVNFITRLLEVCLEKKVRIVLPLVTKELLPLAENRERFESNGITVIVSNPSSLRIANNKCGLYDYFKDFDFIPSYQRCATPDELFTAIEQFGFPAKPVCFKPCSSNGSRGFRILDNNKDRLDLLFNHKPDSTHISLTELKTILQDQTIPELLVSEYLPGMEYSVDLFCIEGKLIIALPRKRIKMTGGISVEGEFEENAAIIAAARTIVEKTGLHGHIGLQFKEAEDKTLKLLEINPRLQGTSVSASGAGINLVLLGLDYACNKVLPPLPVIQWGKKFIRFWDEVYYS